MSDGDESVLRRWARRKHAARLRQGAAVEPNSPAPTKVQEVIPTASDPHDTSVMKEPVPNAAVSSDGGHGGNPPVTDSGARIEDLPDIESLTFDSDFTVFLRQGVPEAIKRRALRKLWSSNPVLANLDGLNDYDFHTMTFLEQLEGAAEPVAEVGRGLRDKIMEGKRAREGRLRAKQPRVAEHPSHDRPIAGNNADRTAAAHQSADGRTEPDLRDPAAFTKTTGSGST